MSDSILKTVQTKLELNTYVMSCYLTKDDLYSEMKEHLKELVYELTCMTADRDRLLEIANEQARQIQK